MPMFEYICNSCQASFELIVNSSTEPACPGCESSDLEKQLSSFAVGRSAPKSLATAPARPRMAGPCGTCGDPRGPGSCKVN